jgi:NAD(P)-dependent dehydrogenase (short-subunit alcohol dehydrogenase family)
MSATDYARRTTAAPTLVPLRLPRSIWRQSPKTPRCPDTPRLDGKLALITGGNAGIGQEITRGLARRGAEVIVAARTRATALAACQSIAAETGATLSHVSLDLADLRSVVEATTQLKARPDGRPVDLLINNAGLWPTAYGTSAQGHEIAFATNTLAHHLLTRRMLDQGLLSPRARVVVLTGDIYIRSSECTPDFRYEGKSGGALAYCRSKLGNLWFAAELQRRYPELEVVSVHPGVIASGLGGGATGFADVVRKLMLLDNRAGAETPLWCATQPGLEKGGYYHNTMGLVRLSPADPASSREKAVALWETLEKLSAEFRAA